MRKVVFVLIALVAFNVQAQKGEYQKKSDLTPEQMATIRTKQLTLAIDLSEDQEQKVLALKLKNAENFSKPKGEKSELTDEQRYEMKIKMLDMQIANQREMKKILNDDQYERWRKMKKSHLNKMKNARKPGDKRGDSHKKKGEHSRIP